MLKMSLPQSHGEDQTEECPLRGLDVPIYEPCCAGLFPLSLYSIEEEQVWEDSYTQEVMNKAHFGFHKFLAMFLERQSSLIRFEWEAR